MRHLVPSLLLVAALCSGCGSSSRAQDQYVVSYHDGDLHRAETCLSTYIKRRIPKGDITRGPDSPWLLLDRAMVRWVKGHEEGAIEDFQLALDALNYYDQRSDPEEIAKATIGETASAYQAPPFEQVMARTYFALALLQSGDQQNAHALLRQAEEWQQQRSKELPDSDVQQLVQNPLTKLLFAAFVEKRGDKTNAEILRTQASELLKKHGLADSIKESSPATATVIVLCHNGNIPCKVSETCPDSHLTSLAVEAALVAQGIDPALSSTVGFEVPVLRHREGGYARRTAAQLGDETQVLQPCYDLDRIARLQLEEEMPQLVAKGVARQVMRRGAVAAVQHADEDWGALADLAMLAWNLNTHADTRSWATLPAQVDMARFDVLPGSYPFRLAVDDPSPTRSYQLQLEAGSLCVINVFNIHPGYTVVQIPNTYIQIAEDSYEKEPINASRSVEHAFMRM